MNDGISRLIKLYSNREWRRKHDHKRLRIFCFLKKIVNCVRPRNNKKKGCAYNLITAIFLCDGSWVDWWGFKVARRLKWIRCSGSLIYLFLNNLTFVKKPKTKNKRTLSPTFSLIRFGRQRKFVSCETSKNQFFMS